MFRKIRKMGRPEAPDWRRIGGGLATDWRRPRNSAKMLRFYNQVAPGVQLHPKENASKPAQIIWKRHSESKRLNAQKIPERFSLIQKIWRLLIKVQEKWQLPEPSGFSSRYLINQICEQGTVLWLLDFRPGGMREALTIKVVTYRIV